MKAEQTDFVVPNPRVRDHYENISRALSFVEESRKTNPQPEILKEREEALADPSGNLSEYKRDQMLVEEFVIRLLAGTEAGLGTFDIFNLIQPDNFKDRELIQRTIWGLEEANIIIKSEDRLFHLNPEIDLKK